MRLIYIMLLSLLFLVQYAKANTSDFPESRLLSYVAELIEQDYQKNGHVSYADWNEFYDAEVGLGLMTQIIPDQPPISMAYGFIEREQRNRFPLGELVLVRLKPMEWPKEWRKSKNINGVENTPEFQQALSEAHLNHQAPIRYFIYVNKNGKVRADWLLESQFSELIHQSKLSLPTKGYMPTPRQLQRKSMRKMPVDTLDSVVAAQPAPAVATVPVPPTPAKSSNPLWWIIGAIAVLATVGIIIRARRATRRG